LESSEEEEGIEDEIDKSLPTALRFSLSISISIEEFERETLLDEEWRGGGGEKFEEEEEEEMGEELEILFVISRKALPIFLFLLMICMIKTLSNDSNKI